MKSFSSPTISLRKTIESSHRIKKSMRRSFGCWKRLTISTRKWGRKKKARGQKNRSLGVTTRKWIGRKARKILIPIAFKRKRISLLKGKRKKKSPLFSPVDPRGPEKSKCLSTCLKPKKHWLSNLKRSKLTQMKFLKDIKIFLWNLQPCKEATNNLLSKTS